MLTIIKIIEPEASNSSQLETWAEENSISIHAKDSSNYLSLVELNSKLYRDQSLPMIWLKYENFVLNHVIHKEKDFCKRCYDINAVLDRNVSRPRTCFNHVDKYNNIGIIWDDSMHPPRDWSDGLSAASLAIIDSAVKKRQQQKTDFVNSKLADANKYLRDYRKSRGCRELTQAELDGDWSQSEPCCCGSCDLGPRHPPSLQLLSRDACGSQVIPKPFRSSVPSAVKEINSPIQRETQSNRFTASVQAKKPKSKRKYKTYKRKPDIPSIQPFDDSLEALELTASELDWLSEKTTPVPSFNVIEVLTASRTGERLSLFNCPSDGQ